ncbi:hypothetical protein D3C81_173770 [compost metagenome]
MISQQKKHKRVTPMPVVSSFPPPNRETVHSEPFTRKMTAEDWEKYGPLNPTPRNKNHFLSGKKGGGKPGTVRDKGKTNGKRTNDAKGKVEGSSSPKVSGL